MTDLSDFGGGMPDAGEKEPSGLDNEDAYKFTRPQCRATKPDGDRCKNPTSTTPGAQFCPQHIDSNPEGVFPDDDRDQAGDGDD